MTHERDVTALLERAVADLVPAERRPTDAVLARAASRPWARLRKAVAGVVGVAVIGGGAVVVATGDDDGRTVDAPKPLRLTVEPPAGWSVVDRPTRVDCTTDLAPRTAYRDAAVADLSSCPDGGPVPDGPVLLVGRIDRAVADRIRATGTPVTAAGLAGYATGYDNVVSTVTWVPVGDHGGLGYVALAPRGEDDGSAYRDPLGFGTPTASREVLAAAAAVTARGSRPDRPVLPVEVSAVDLRVESLNVDPAPGARVTDPAAVEDVIAAMRPVPGETCGEATSFRTFHLQDADTGRWSRVDVFDDGTGCRTVAAELGGSGRISGDPVAAATAADASGDVSVGDGARVVTAHGLAAAVPDGWDVVRTTSLDPCTLRRPSVVVADSVDPSCEAGPYARPYQPFLLLTSARLEDERFRTASGRPLPPESRRVVAGRGVEVTWTKEMFDVSGVVMTAEMGVVDGVAGRFLLAGVRDDVARVVQEGVGRG